MRIRSRGLFNSHVCMYLLSLGGILWASLLPFLDFLRDFGVAMVLWGVYGMGCMYEDSRSL